MLNSISWGTYLLSVLLLLSVYYGWVGLRYYRSELLNFFTKRPAGEPNQLSSLRQAGATVMGAVAAEPEQLREEWELLFAEPEPDEAANVREIAGSAISSALATEVQALVGVITETGETKENFLMLFQLLAEKYAAETNDEERTLINLQLLEQADGFAFDLTSEDLEKQWQATINH